MRVTVLELPATWGHPGRALDDVDARLAAGAATDLVLLPEAALAGYVSVDRTFDLTGFAEPIDGPTACRCAALARTHAVHLIAPLVLHEDDANYNAMACFDPRGECVFVYRKRHPWFPEVWATPGMLPPPVVEICGRTVTIAICYDLHFVADDAADALTRADLLLFPSAWVERQDTRADRLAALACGFDLEIANANWGPGVVRVPGQGGSCAIDRTGKLLARAELLGRIDIEL